MALPMPQGTQVMARNDPYFYRRAETELRMAQDATDPAASKVHYELANLYLDRFYNPDSPLGSQPPVILDDD